MRRLELLSDKDREVLLDDPRSEGPLELEVIVDQEEGLAFGLFWEDGDRLLAVFTAVSA